MIVMHLGGLWHGAAWTFVFWGGLHGAYLCINHFWRRNFGRHVPQWLDRRLLPVYALTTFAAVVVAWVFFRAPSFAAALNILEGMAGRTTATLPAEIPQLLGTTPFTFAGIAFDGKGGLTYADMVATLFYLALAAAIVFFAPNTASLFGLDGTARDWSAAMPSPRTAWRQAVAVGLLLWISMFGILGTAPTEFLYFRF